MVIGDDPIHSRRYEELLTDRGYEVLPTPRLAENSAVNDFWLIAGAAHVIVSNSTFCWWATTVGDKRHVLSDRSRRVLAPAGWILGAGRVVLESSWTAVDSGARPERSARDEARPSMGIVANCAAAAPLVGQVGRRLSKLDDSRDPPLVGPCHRSHPTRRDWALRYRVVERHQTTSPTLDADRAMRQPWASN